ncbi:MAG TPA: PEP/pyruvate-binding domain-containing protein, partial [Candidatus Nanoarchaeia archaeon]|nr:PEP/pyruvate-binding domain-containing protein [Candidatus Nanoarchaeia archaeon]
MEKVKVTESGKFVKWFSKLNSKDVLEAGEKGANLGELFNMKLPVPNGFVITTYAYDYFLEKSGIKEKINSFLSQIDVKNNEQLENYISNIKNLILRTEFPEELKEEILDSYEHLGTDKLEIEKGSALDILNNAAEPIFVAVRSSLPFEKIYKTNNLREQDTYLNVKGNDVLLSHVKKCFSSLFNIETVKRFLGGGKSHDELKIAVVIERMIEGEKSGIVHSTNNSGEVFIQAIWGLGEGFNVREITPDQYVLSKDLKILDKKINEKKEGVVRDASGSLKKIQLTPERNIHSVLTDYEIQRLGDLAEKIEGHFDSVQEIEFVISEDIYVVQTRKVDSLEIKNGTSGKEIENEEILNEKEILGKKRVDENVGPVQKITKTKLKLVVDSPHFLQDYKETGLKKIGFLKIENIIKESGKHPNYYLRGNYVNEYENVIYEGIKPIIDNFDEVWMRTSDFKSDDFKNLEGAPEKQEKNPSLGLHGIRYGLKNLDILESELRALKRFSSNKNVGILIPGIVSVEELKKVSELLGKINFAPKIGIVVETPAAVQLIKEFTEEGIDLILIETNDLIQNLLCIDLENEELDYLYDDNHPALMYQLEYMIRVCKRRGIETTVSGKALLNEGLLKFLIQKEITSVCVKPEFAKSFSEKIHGFEKELFSGTDKEPRKYELEKTKEEYIEEKNEKSDEPKTIEDINNLEESEKLKKDIEFIEDEKKNYEENGVLEEERIESLEPEKVEEYGEEEIEEVKEHPEEEFDDKIENFEEEDIVDDVDSALEAIEKEKDEYLGENSEEKKDD